MIKGTGNRHAVIPAPLHSGKIILCRCQKHVMTYLHALGPAGGAGGIHDIGAVLKFGEHVLPGGTFILRSQFTDSLNIYILNIFFFCSRSLIGRARPGFEGLQRFSVRRILLFIRKGHSGNIYPALGLFDDIRSLFI